MTVDLEPYRYVIILGALVVGQFISVYLPYRKKRIEDGRPFDSNYLVSSIVTYVGTGTVALGTPIIANMPLTAASVMTLIFGAGVLQERINRVVPKSKRKVIRY